MKTHKTLLAVLLGLLVAPVTAALAEDTMTEAQTRAQLEGRHPIPMRMEAPRVGRTLIGQEVQMIFRIDTNGRTSGIRSNEAFWQAGDLVDEMTEAIRHWRFRPALDRNGQPKAVKVLLPVVVVEGENDTRLHARLVYPDE